MRLRVLYGSTYIYIYMYHICMYVYIYIYINIYIYIYILQVGLIAHEYIYIYNRAEGVCSVAAYEININTTRKKPETLGDLC